MKTTETWEEYWAGKPLRERIRILRCGIDVIRRSSRYQFRRLGVAFRRLFHSLIDAFGLRLLADKIESWYSKIEAKL